MPPDRRIVWPLWHQTNRRHLDQILTSKVATVITPLMLLTLFIHLVMIPPVVLGQYQWQQRDSFDQIRAKLDDVNGKNCKGANVNKLFLSPSSVTHVPNLQWIGINPVFPNRTNLLHVHNMALSRAFFLSYILQKANDDAEPGFLYYYLSTIADVAANRFINSSAFYYAPNHAFTSSYRGLFNKTLALFGPRAYRADDFNDPYHMQGTSTLNTIEATDVGVVPNNSLASNYTNEQYRINEWYNAWLPDPTRRHDSKTTYTVQITHQNSTNETFVFHGPPAFSDPPGPVKWFKPYFDCGRSNKWVYGSSVPIPDIYPRHTGWRHIEIPMYVAVAVMEIDYERIDINQCPIGEGNPHPNLYSNTARCHERTTECEPIHGYGFRRGGYQCRCRPGYRLPKTVKNWFKGEKIERATQTEFENEFQCEKIGYVAVRTQNVLPINSYDRLKLIHKMDTLTGVLSNHSNSPRLDPYWLHKFMQEVKPNNCHTYQPEQLVLRGDIAYGKEIQLENQARMVLRLANFLSAFLQVVDPDEKFAEFRVPDKPLTKDQVIGEVLSTIIGDQQLLGVGVIFEPKKFSVNDTYFAPYAYQTEPNTRKFFVDDLSRFPEQSSKHYINKEYYKHLRNRWATIVDQEVLETYTTKINIRYNAQGYNLIRYDRYPLEYHAAELSHGYWSSPYYDCGGFHHQWLVSYAAPFFGWDSIKSHLELKGMVVMNTKLEHLDINQCGHNIDSLRKQDQQQTSDPISTNDFPVHKYSSSANAFRNTHKCDRLSSHCVPIMGRRFYHGGYKCECDQGFEYPFNDEINYFDGQVIEDEYINMYKKLASRFDTLACRVAHATSIYTNNIPLSLYFLTTVFFILYYRLHAI